MTSKASNKNVLETRQMAIPIIIAQVLTAQALTMHTFRSVSLLQVVVLKNALLPYHFES